LKNHIHIYFSFLLLVSFSWQSFATSFIFLKFKFNQKELSETVCENKNKPKSCCAAKCYLDKEIKKEDKRQSNSSSHLKDKKEKTELRTGLLQFNFTNLMFIEHYTQLNLKSTVCGFLVSIFHPPLK